MNVESTCLAGVYILTPDVFGDNRGFFMESWSKRRMEEAGLYYDFVQDNHSSSTVKGTLRGIHFQKGEWCQAKLVRCTRGSVLDVAVDLRKASPTYKQWVGVELSEENKKRDPLLVARTLLEQAGLLTAEALAEYLRTRLSRYEIPAEIVFADEIPRTPSGKPDLRAVREHFAEHAR